MNRVHRSQADLAGDSGYQIIGGVSIDITKAFDTVDHRLLLIKLENLGIWLSNLYFFVLLLSCIYYSAIIEWQSITRCRCCNKGLHGDHENVR